MAKGVVTANFTVRNAGNIRGKDVAQLYVAGAGWEAPRRLAGFHKVDLKPGVTAKVSMVVDPRLLATFDSATNSWRISGGTYRLMLGSSVNHIAETIEVRIAPKTLPASWHP